MAEDKKEDKAPKVNQSEVIRSAVKDALSNSGETVVERVVEALVEKELLERKTKVEKALQSLESMSAELKKVKPDSVTYDADGKVKDESYSKGTIENKKKLVEKIGKLESALDKALTENDYQGLDKLLKG